MPLPDAAKDPAAISNGRHAHGLLTRHCRRIVELHAAVLEDRDPEPLHQMRVAMRRLRTSIQQFSPGLELPSTVSDRRLAKSVRRLGMARDLDVLRERLEQTLLPEVNDQERRRLQPVQRQLARERRIAQDHLGDVLQSSRHLELVADLQAWLRKPVFTPLGEQPLADWWSEWHVPASSALMLHPGWWIDTVDRNEQSLHDLRKRIKTVRYQLENLVTADHSAARSWIDSLRQAQGLLGDLNDLTVLRAAIDDQLSHGLTQDVPGLAALLQRQRQEGWLQWRALAAQLIQPEPRHTRLLLEK